VCLYSLNITVQQTVNLLLLLEDDTGIDNLEALAFLIEHDWVSISLSNFVLKIIDELRDTRHNLSESSNIASLLTTSTLKDRSSS